jgi:hypothetical protein
LASTTNSSDMDELIANVEKAYWDYDATNLRNTPSVQV